MFFSLLLAQAPAASPSGAGSGLLSMLPFVFIFVIMYYVMLRPQMRRQKEQARLVSSLKTGDRVVTASGIHGLISNVKETTVIVKVADNVKLEMEKTAVTNVVKGNEAKAS
jgi:preprotein translocase subunit YajC